MCFIGTTWLYALLNVSWSTSLIWIVVALEKKHEIIQKEVENIDKGLKSLAYDEGGMESLQKVRLLFSFCILY